MKVQKFILSTLLLFGALTFVNNLLANPYHLEDPYSLEFVMAQDTIVPPITDRTGDFINNPSTNPFDLDDPDIIEKNVEYDPESGLYIITETIGENFYRAPTYMTFDEYLDYQAQQQQQNYFDALNGVSGTDASSARNDPMDQIDVKNSLVDRLFGGTGVDIRPQGNIDLTFGVDFQKVENPILTLRQQRQGGFDFDMAIQMNVEGKIGEKLRLSTNYNTQATFDFENQMKLDYDSDAFTEDEIMKKIEAGNVSLPLRGSLIQGAQSLFGLKTELQFGKLRLTLVAAQQKSKRESIQIEGGAQLQEFEIRADEYDENRHFFLSHYNRNSFESALQNLPQINTLFKVTKIEVWVTNDRNVTEGVRDIVAVADLGEYDNITNDNPLYQTPSGPRNRDIFGTTELPANNSNDIFQALKDNPFVRNLDNAVATLGSVFGFQQTKDFEKVSARLLSPSEYTFNPDLGFVSINVNLRPDQVLGVAYEYDYNGTIRRVGEFSNDYYDADTLGVLFVKMLKSTTQRIDLPNWDLMMKNVYSIGAFQVNQQDFKFDIYYEDPGGGDVSFLPETNLAGQNLLRVFNLDRLNVQGDPQPDGIFDFVPGVTINPRNGRVMFPVLEPFGSALGNSIDNPNEARKFTYQQLYDSTITRAREYPEFNRFVMRGRYKSTISSEISLGAFNLPPGSVRVSGGGAQMIEGVDYEVDYNIGRVKILNDAILNSGIPINVSFEDNTLFSFQTKTLLGLRADYEVSKNLNVGGTYLHLFERPFTQKVNIGDDPINNRIVGLDFNYNRETPWLTKAIDKLPFIETKEPSDISITAEAAALKPGHASAIDQRESDGERNKGGIVYIDDFEGSASSVDLRYPATQWVLASVPQNDENNNNPLFPESEFIDTTLTGVNRAKLSWYRIDQGSVAGSQDDPYTATIQQTEVFRNIQIAPTANTNVFPLDLHYRPDQRGPYNFDLPEGTAYSEGIATDGSLNEPETRWGGIMRALNTNDFQAANIEYVEFWMLDPFLTDPGNDGDLYLNLGNVSEDVLRDSRLFFENGIPETTAETRMDTTTWSNIPRTQAITNAFSSDAAERIRQDVGLDGFNDDGELQQFSAVANLYNGYLNDAAYDEFLDDPSADNFKHFREYDDDADIFERYSRYYNPEGNSKPNDPNNNSNFSESGTNIPDSEDLNNDNTLNETESYYQYRIPLKDENEDGRLDFENSDFVTDTVYVNNPGGTDRVWYRFKIPLDHGSRKAVGGIQDFRSIRFIRMYVNGFERDVTLRFVRMELVRNQWRRYMRTLAFPSSDGGLTEVPNGAPALFDVNAVNVEENTSKIPFGYTLPPGINRENSNNTAFPNILQNEQSLSMEVCGLQPNFGKAIYKIINLDMNLFERLRMFVHAERDLERDLDLEDGDLSVFVRLGSDFENNYYEYEIPLNLSDENHNFDITDSEYKFIVWPEDNELDIDLEMFRNIKIQRNADGALLNKKYEIDDPNDPTGRRKIRIIGNPSLGQAKGVMIGVVNRDDVDHCAEVWVNELRVNGFNEQGGFAALARFDAKLADLGNFQATWDYSSFGYGGLEQKLAQRQQERIRQYALATNLELGKFFPEDWGLRLPFYANYSETARTPKFDPYDKDLDLEEKLERESDRTVRDSLRKQAEDFTSIKTVNLTNVRKDLTNKDKKPRPWNIENFSASYGYTETLNRNSIIENDETDQHYGAIDYSYSLKPKYIMPFKNLIKKDKHFKLLTELNFNLVPNTFTFNTQMNRQIQQTKYRFTGDDPRLNTFYNKQFRWDRNYNLNWDITKALKIGFNAVNNAVIDELPEYDLITEEFNNAETKKNFIKDNIRNGGRTKNYTHNFNVNYTLPFKKIPILNWVQVKAQYTADYSWNAGSLGVADSLGNIIQNGQARQLNGDLNFESLYNKSKYLKKINSPRKSSKGKSSRGKDSKLGNDEGDTDRGGKSRGKSGRDKPGKDKGLEQDKEDEKNKNGKSGRTKPGEEDGSGELSKDGKDGKGKKDPKDKKDKKKRDREPTVAERVLIRPLMTLRKARLSYSENFGTIVPGYMPATQYFGLSDGFTSPGWDFVAGWQPDIANNDFSNDWLSRNSNWISDNTFLNQQILQNKTSNIDAKITLEPFADFRVELDANRSFTDNKSLYFKDTIYGDGSDLVHVLPREVGSYNISYFAMNTLFEKDIFQIFKNFENNRAVISSRIGDGVDHPTDIEFGEYKEGYGRYQQDVLIPAFLAAYTGKDISTVPASQDYTNELFKTVPKFNWRLTYNGLSKIPMFKDIFASFNITHAYKSGLQVNSFLTDTDFDVANPFGVNDNTLNYFSKFEIPTIVISEQFSPLIGVDMRMKNDMTFRVDFKKSRNLSMSFIDYRLSETKTTEYVVGFGYRMKDVILEFLYPNSKTKRKKGSRKNRKKTKKKKDDEGGDSNQGKTQQKGNDMNFKFDFSYRDDITVSHLLDQGVEPIPTRGLESIRISPSVDYDVNKKLNVRLFFDYSKTIPKTTASFPITNTQGGVTIRFSLN